MIPTKDIKIRMIIRLKLYNYNPLFFDTRGVMKKIGDQLMTISTITDRNSQTGHKIYILAEDKNKWDWRNIDFVKANTIQTMEG